MAKFKDQEDKPSIINILMHFDKDCSEFYSRDTVMEIVKFLNNSLESPISDEEQKKLDDAIPSDKKLVMAEVFKILKDSPISEEVDSAAQKLDEIAKNKTCLLCLPVSCFRWKRKSSAKDLLAKFKD